MSDYHKFQTVDKKFTLCVKNNFLEKCPNPETLTAYDLNNKHRMFKFLHNPSGPAVIKHMDKSKEQPGLLLMLTPEGVRTEYWIDGVCLNKEDQERAKKLDFDANFSTKLDDLVSE